jgi:polar amino acid transport system substrate-binding protein
MNGPTGKTIASEGMAMHIYRNLGLALLLAAAWLPCGANAQETLRVLGIDSPPQASAADGRGIMSDAALEAVKRAGLTGKLEFPPWSRAQEEVQAGHDILITGLSRTPEREDKYTWLFPVFTLDRAFATTGKQVSSFAEAKQSFKQVAVALRSAQYDMLLREGFTTDQFSTLSTEKQDKIPTLLALGRVDAWFTSIAEMKFALRSSPDAERIVIGPPIGQGTVQFVACSKDCNPDLVGKLKAAAAEMTADGTMQAIIARYQ